MRSEENTCPSKSRTPGAWPAILVLVVATFMTLVSFVKHSFQSMPAQTIAFHGALKRAKRQGVDKFT